MKILLTTSLVKLINKGEFAKIVLNENFITFVIYIVILKVEILIHLL